MAVKLSPEQREDLTDAIGKLKASEKSHWTDNGYANLEVLSKLVGWKVSRDMVNEIAPSLTRKSAQLADPSDDDSWMNEGEGPDAGMTESNVGNVGDEDLPKLPEAPVKAADLAAKLGTTPGAVAGASTQNLSDQVDPSDQRAYNLLVASIAEEEALIKKHRDQIAKSQEEVRRADIRLKEKQAQKNVKFPPLSQAELIRRHNQRNFQDRLERARQADELKKLTGGMSLNPAAPVDANPPRRVQGK